MADTREKVLWWAAERRLQRDKPYILAITGSIGKTSTKLAIGNVLQAAFPRQVRVGFGNLNTYLGVPLAILGFRVDFHEHNLTWQWPFVLVRAIWRGLFGRLPRFLILELGADKPGDIKELTKHIHPDMAVVTAIGPAHLLNYDSEDEIAMEKGQILMALRPGGTAVLNQEDKFTPMLKNFTDEKIVYFSSPTSSIALTIARTIGVALDLPIGQVELALKASPLPKHRLSRQRIGSWEVIDDTYNANPLSMRAALSELAKLPGRKVAILGDMRELGKQEAKFHQEIGAEARRVADLVIAVGPLAKEYGAKHWYPDAPAAMKGVVALLKEGDSILVKGSRAMKMEKIVEELKNV